MKRLIYISLALIVITLQSCRDESYTIETANVPVYMDVDQWRSLPLEVLPARAIEKPGQIYIYGDLLFVVEPLKGIHIIDNSNPSSPQPINFISVYATSQISIRNDVLFTNSYFDLVSIDISNPEQPYIKSRTEDVVDFYDITALPNYNPNYLMAEVNQPNNVILGWKLEEVKMSSRDAWLFCGTGDHMLESNQSTSDVSFNETGNQIGIGGSLAKFTIMGDNLYTLESYELKSFAIQGNGSISLTNEQTINRNCETIFPNQNHLFIGTTSGMLIYDLVNPDAPAYKSEVNHIVSCDPVVVEGNRAYATLSTGASCWGDNSLEVMNVDDFTAPFNITRYALTHPLGLGVDGNLLFICDDVDGLKVFDRTDDHSITNHLLLHEPSILSRDVIPHDGLLIVRAEDGIYQYSYTNQNNFHQLSKISTTP